MDCPMHANKSWEEYKLLNLKLIVDLCGSSAIHEASHDSPVREICEPVPT
jgi:hypothetical protein